eukprot:6149630-Prymnesium_polylepis.1
MPTRPSPRGILKEVARVELRLGEPLHGHELVHGGAVPDAWAAQGDYLLVLSTTRISCQSYRRAA